MSVAITEPKQTEVERLFDLGKPSLHALSYALRHPDTWPKGFVWNYDHCHTCAMGLAHTLWEAIPAVHKENASSVMARQFAIPYGVAQSIFMGIELGGPASWATLRKVKTVIARERLGLFRSRPVEIQQESRVHLDLKDITPEMVADQIDAYLARAE
jgi:hypothetical protein